MTHKQEVQSLNSLVATTVLGRAPTIIHFKIQSNHVPRPGRLFYPQIKMYFPYLALGDNCLFKLLFRVQNMM